MYTHLDKYMSSGFDAVEGWCSPNLSDICKLIDTHQQERGVTGGIAEIGVHHGRFFILLNALTKPGETSFAIDIFDDQSLNIDYSGLGSKSIFLSNLDKHDRHAGNNVVLIAADSTTTQLAALIKPPVRIFSVDGGHTAEHTIADLKSAQSASHAEGVVILDDILNTHWLGVIEGCMHFLLSRPTLVPFAIGHNKLLMSNLSHAERYATLFRNSSLASKPRVRFMGWDLVAL